MEGGVEYGGYIRHVGDEVRLAGNEGLYLRDDLLVLFFFCHEDGILWVIGCLSLLGKVRLVYHGASEGIELDIPFLLAG